MCGLQTGRLHPSERVKRTAHVPHESKATGPNCGGSRDGPWCYVAIDGTGDDSDAPPPGVGQDLPGRPGSLAGQRAGHVRDRKLQPGPHGDPRGQLPGPGHLRGVRIRAPRLRHADRAHHLRRLRLRRHPGGAGRLPPGGGAAWQRAPAGLRRRRPDRGGLQAGGALVHRAPSDCLLHARRRRTGSRGRLRLRRIRERRLRLQRAVHDQGPVADQSGRDGTAARHPDPGRPRALDGHPGRSALPHRSPWPAPCQPWPGPLVCAGISAARVLGCIRWHRCPAGAAPDRQQHAAGTGCCWPGARTHPPAGHPVHAFELVATRPQWDHRDQPAHRSLANWRPAAGGDLTVLIAYPVWFLRLLAWWLRAAWRRLRRPPTYVSFLIEAPPPEPATLPPPFWQRFFGRPPLSVQALAAQLRRVTAEPRVKGVVLHLRPLALTQGQVGALRDLIEEVRASEVRVICWAPSYTAATYQVACAAHEVLMQPGGMIAPLGIAREYLFLAEALESVGLRADLLQVSPYKSAGDILTRREFSPEAREMAEWLADSAFGDAVAAVAAGRGLDERAARALVEASPFTDEQALAAGAVDAVLAEEALAARLGGGVASWGAARRRLPSQPPARPGRIVGMLRVEGLIVDGRSRRAPLRPPIGPPLVLQDQCGDLTVVEQARALATDRRVGAVVLWVDSSGGSASASEAIAAALSGLARRKPVVAVMGAVAGSGGYYVTTPAARVFAHPGTVTGSIGVIAGKVVAGGLLDRLLIGRERVARGEHSAMWSAEAPFTHAERDKMAELVGRSYGLFLERVAAARRRPVAEIEPVAGGRVLTGSQALRHGLVDELGGLERAAA